jgi:dCTP deaminase
LVDDEGADVSEGIAVGVDLSGLGPERMVGYRAKRHTGLIDVERRAGYDVADFWEPMHSCKERNLILDPGEFYIVASKEAVQVLLDYAAEMVPFDPLVGEFRVHYASSSATRAPADAARALLEVRSREVPFILEHGGTKAIRRLTVRHHSRHDRRARTQNRTRRRQRWRQRR